MAMSLRNVMVIDTSAVLAILLGEPEAEDFTQAIIKDLTVAGSGSCFNFV